VYGVEEGEGAVGAGGEDERGEGAIEATKSCNVLGVVMHPDMDCVRM